jgi:hypothetical protein
MANWCLWAKVWFLYCNVVVTHVLPVKIWLHASKFHKLSSFLVPSQEKRPLHIDMTNWFLWVKGWFAYSGVAVSCSPLPVKMWLHASKFHKLPSFSAFSHEKRPLHTVN